MKFKLDENLPVELAADIRAAGHEAETVHDEGLTGSVDPLLLQQAHAEGRALLTMDKGIADVRVYPPADYSGIVLFRLKVTGRRAVLAFIRQHLPALLQADLAGHLIVVSESGMRIR